MSTNFIPERPFNVDYTQGNLRKFVEDADFALQEKFNGKRRAIIKVGNSIHSLNKEGEVRTIPARLALSIRNDVPFDFIIDAELMVGEQHLKIFDAISIGTRNMVDPNDPEPYEARVQAIRDTFKGMVWCTPAYTAYTYEEKARLTIQLIQDNAEGLVCRRLHAAYKQGDSHQHFKIKFTKTLDAVVMNHNVEGKASVDIGLYTAQGRLQRIGACSTLGKPAVKVGDVLEVIYLYGTTRQHVVQPRMALIRDDKQARACTIDQIQVNRDMV